jgi:hypothetical protein
MVLWGGEFVCETFILNEIRTRGYFFVMVDTRLVEIFYLPHSTGTGFEL